MNKVLKLAGKIILVLVAVLVIFFIGIKIYFAANSGDDELLDNSHLILKTINIPKEKNGWHELKRAEEVMYYPEEKNELIDKMISGENWDQKFVSDFIEKNRESFVYIESGFKKEITNSPLLNNFNVQNIKPDTVIESLIFSRKLNKLNLILAKNYIKNGDFDKGLERLVLSVNFTNKTKIADMVLIDYLIELSLRGSNYIAIKSIINESDIYKNKSIDLQNALEINKNNKESLAQVFKGEFWFNTNALNSLYAGDNLGEDLSEAEKKFISKNISKESNFYFKPNKYKNALNKSYTRNIENSYRSCDNLIPFDESNHFEYSNPISLIFTENAVGKILLTIADVNWDSLQKKRCAEDFNIVALQVKLASNAYKNDFKKYPLSIKEMTEAGYLVVKVTENINGWSVIYNKEMGELEVPKELENI